MKKSSLLLLTFLLFCLLLISCRSGIENKPQQFISCFIDSVDHGLKFLKMDTDPVRLETISTLKTTFTPAYFETSQNKNFLYVLSSDPLAGKEHGGSVYAYRMAGNFEEIVPLNSVSSYGEGPCHINFDHTGKFAVVANYLSGNFVIYPLHADGSIGDSICFIQFKGNSVNPQRQEGPHVHSSVFSPDNQMLYVADLGTDRIMVYDFDDLTGQIKPASRPWISSTPGTGPRHLALHPKLEILYVAEELSSSVGVYNTALLKDTISPFMQRISALPPGFSGKSTVAGIRVSADGQFVYVSNRGHNSIAIFKVDTSDGRLEAEGHQSTHGIRPRNFTLSEDENFLLVANRDSDNIVVFKRDSSSGQLVETGIEMSIPDPKCLKKF